MTEADINGVEPLYDLALAAALVPMSLYALKCFLWRNKKLFPARYRMKRTFPKQRRSRVRLLYAREIRAIRTMVLKGDLGTRV